MDSKTRKSMPSVLRRMTQEHQVILVEAAQEADRLIAQAKRRRRQRRVYLPLAALIVSAGMMWFVCDYFTNGSVVGQVTDFDGRPIAGAVVQVEGASHRVLTDADGMFHLDRVRPGAHWLLVQIPNQSGTSVLIHSVGREQIRCGTVKLFARGMVSQ